MTVKVGAQARRTTRDAVNVPFDVLGFRLTEAQRAIPAGQIFDGTYASHGLLTLQINALSGRYEAEDVVAAGYVMADLPVSRSLRLLGGVRGDINPTWNYDIYGMVGKVAQPETYLNDLNTNRIQDALWKAGRAIPTWRQFRFESAHHHHS